MRKYLASSCKFTRNVGDSNIDQVWIPEIQTHLKRMLLRMFVKMSEMKRYHLQSYIPQLLISTVRMLYDVFLKSSGLHCCLLRHVFSLLDVFRSTCTWRERMYDRPWLSYGHALACCNLHRAYSSNCTEIWYSLYWRSRDTWILFRNCQMYLLCYSKLK